MYWYNINKCVHVQYEVFGITKVTQDTHHKEEGRHKTHDEVKNAQAS